MRRQHVPCTVALFRSAKASVFQLLSDSCNNFFCWCMLVFLSAQELALQDHPHNRNPHQNRAAQCLQTLGANNIVCKSACLCLSVSSFVFLARGVSPDSLCVPLSLSLSLRVSLGLSLSRSVSRSVSLCVSVCLSAPLCLFVGCACLLCLCVWNSVTKGRHVFENSRGHGATGRAVPTKLRTVVEALKTACVCTCIRAPCGT